MLNLLKNARLRVFAVWVAMVVVGLTFLLTRPACDGVTITSTDAGTAVDAATESAPEAAVEAPAEDTPEVTE